MRDSANGDDERRPRAAPPHGRTTPDDEEHLHVADVVGFVADRVVEEKAVLGGFEPPPGKPQLVDPTGHRARWRARLARLRLRAGYRAARSRARVMAWRRRMNATPAGRVGVKLAVAVIGTLVVAIGVILLPLPGPGWLIVFTGLAILALEFRWARQLLTFGREQFRRWTALVREGSWVVRLVSGVGLAVVILVAAWLSARFAFGIKVP